MAKDRCGRLELVTRKVTVRYRFVAETRFKTGRDSTLQGWIWRCDSLFDADNADSNGVVIIAHGLGDHGGRYRDFAQRLNKKGWHVVAFDLLGHGESPGRRGCVDSYDGVLSDIGTVRRDVQKRLPGARQVLLGHSMGGNLAVNYALRQQEFIGDGGNTVSYTHLTLPTKA